MGGRGRGRGNTGGLTYEQLQSMGVTRNEGNSVASGGPGSSIPPPLFPKLECRPLPLLSGASVDYMLIIKRQFLDYLHDSPSYVQTSTLNNDIERYSDKYKVLSTDGKNVKGVSNGSVCWNHFPSELRPHYTRKTQEKKRKAKVVDIDTKLKKLEQDELKEKDTQEGESVGVKVESADVEGDEGEAIEEEDPDEEMDDGTDYLDNYFDNGEGFEDEDENLDDGPVY